MAQSPKSFTTISLVGILNVLKNQCGISQAFDPAAGGLAPPATQFDAIWDTGATNSCVTQTVVDACGLTPIGVAEVHGVQGSTFEDVFLVNIYLPNNVAFGGVRVTKAKLTGAEILIGMDVINQGDFAVTNMNGRTKFSFRVPSMQEIDFVAAQNPKLTQKLTHGGGKRSRKRRKGPGGKGRRK
ncbi:MAG: hypothetical protein AABM64_18015 [Pseudomonadota bacterium]